MKVYSGNDKFKCIEPEKVDVKSVYAFTLNPENQCDSGTKSKTYTDRVKDVVKIVSNQLKDIFYKIAIYTLFLEVSKNGRLHFHGMITIQNPLAFFVESIPRLQGIGAYEIDTIDDHDIWDVYIHKQASLFTDGQPCISNKKEDVTFTWTSGDAKTKVILSP